MDSKNGVLLRAYMIYIVLVLFALVIVGSVLKIQIKEKDGLLEYAKKNEIRLRDEKAFRGNIFSKGGELLATTVPVYTIFFDPVAVENDLFNQNVGKLADSLSRMLKNKSKSQYETLLKNAKKNKRRYVKIANKLSMKEYQRIKTFPIFKEGKYKGGLIAEKSYSRELPYGELAARTIGYVREEEDIFVGLEGAYHYYLKGIDGKQKVRRINGNFWMPIESEQNVQPHNGDDIYTSIDIEIQDVAENALKRCLIENDALQGCVVLMDVKTGFVEVMASLSYNEESQEYEEAYNFALRQSVEPGSTFKAVSMLALLENDPTISIDDKLNLGKYDFMRFYGRTMQDSHRVTDEDGYTTIRNAFEQSSNVGLAYMTVNAFEKNPEKFVDLIYKTSIQKPLNLDIKGEGRIDIKDTDDKRWSKLSLPWMSIGYEVMITPIQLLTFYNAIANDGVMLKPQFVKEIRHANVVNHVFEPIVINEKIASERTIETLQELLCGVVENGTGKGLKNLGFPVAGKTGTAQISQGKAGYNKKNYTATFVGYFPADEPKYSCIIMVSNPRGRSYYGASVSAPVFKEIAAKVYATRLGIVDEDNEYMPDYEEFIDASVVNFDDFAEYCSMNDFHFIDNEDNDEWVSVRETDNVVYASPVSFSQDTVPDVRGMNVTDAVYLLESMGWDVDFSGLGKVKSQKPKANTKLKKGGTVNLILSSK